MPLPELPELEELYRRYRTDLYRYLCHLTHDPTEAEDTLAEHTDTRLHGRIWSAAQTAASCGRGRMPKPCWSRPPRTTEKLSKGCADATAHICFCWPLWALQAAACLTAQAPELRFASVYGAQGNIVDISLCYTEQDGVTPADYVDDLPITYYDITLVPTGDYADHSSFLADALESGLTPADRIA